MMTRPWSTRSRRCSAPKAPTSSRQGRRSPHRGRPKDGFAHGRRERAPRDWNLSRRPCQRTTSPRNRNTRSETLQAERVSAPGAGPRTPSRSMVPSKEAHLLKAVLGSARVTASILPALGAMNVWTPQTYGPLRRKLTTPPCPRPRALASAPSALSVRTECSAGIAKTCGSRTSRLRPVASAEPLVPPNASRTATWPSLRGRLVVPVEDAIHPALTPYRLTSQLSCAGRTVAHDPRLPKPGILRIV